MNHQQVYGYIRNYILELDSEALAEIYNLLSVSKIEYLGEFKYVSDQSITLSWQEVFTEIEEFLLDLDYEALVVVFNKLSVKKMEYNKGNFVFIKG